MTTGVGLAKWTLALAAILLAPGRGQLAAGTFEFSTLVRLGSSSNSSQSWEIGIGNNTAITQTASLQNYWSNGQSRQFQLIYSAPANNLQVRLYANNGSSFASWNFTPAGGPAPANSLWTLPASSFFVTALPPSSNSGSSSSFNTITVSNLSLSTPTGGALNILSPLTSTTLRASSGTGLASQTVRPSADIVFRSDSSGSWRLSGFVTMNFSGISGNSSSFDRLQFGLSAQSEAPEPVTWSVIALGLGLAATAQRYRWIRADPPLAKART